MCVLDRILSLLETQGKTQKELADFLGVKKNCVTDWKSGKSRSFEKYIYQIAAFFGVSVDYLQGKEKSSSELTDELLSLDDKILKRLATLPADKRKQALEYLEFLVSKNQDTE